MSGANNTQYARFIDFHGRNPDVLNSIANLSSDEVFTPPEFANRMLDTLEKAWADSNGGEVIWQNSLVTFLDPFTKSGVFLREIASRLIKGLESEFPDLQERVDHVLTKQVFGIATTKLTSLMARRSLYCSKLANGKHSVTKKFNTEEGNIWFEPMEHTWVGGNTKVLTMDADGNEVERSVTGKCSYCGASRQDFDRQVGLEQHAYGMIHNRNPKVWVREIFGEEMQFDVIVGNPPYQISTGGSGGAGVQARPLYNKFIEQAIALEPRFLTVVTPSRWFSGGMGLDGFREAMLSDDRIRAIHDFPDSNQVFPGTQIKGGVSFFLWDRDNPGPVDVNTYENGQVVSRTQRRLLEPGCDIFIRYNQGLTILQKVLAKESSAEKPLLALPDEKKFMNLVGSIGAFGLDTTFKGKTEKELGDLKVYRNGGIGFLPQKDLLRGHEAIDWWKVFIPRAGSGSDSFPHSILGKPFIGEPGSVSSWTYMHIGPFDNREEAENAISYISSRFFRFLVLLHKPTQDATRSVYSFVPLQDFSVPWDDSKLFEKYGLGPDDIAFIVKMVRAAGESDE